jgi:hypothetical protein
MGAADREQELRRRVAGSLRRHRAYSSFVALADRSNGVDLPAYARELQSLFPAVEARRSTWVGYARVYLQWFEYAGLALAKGTHWHPAPDGSPGVGELLGGRVIRRVKGGWPNYPVGPAVELILKISRNEITSSADAHKGAMRDLLILGAVGLTDPGRPFLRDPGIVVDDKVVPEKLRSLINALPVPGVAEGLTVLKQNPGAGPATVGAAVKAALAADWAPGTTYGVGKNLRSWARFAGINVRTPRRREGEQRTAVSNTSDAEHPAPSR